MCPGAPILMLLSLTPLAWPGPAAPSTSIRSPPPPASAAVGGATGSGGGGGGSGGL